MTEPARARLIRRSPGLRNTSASASLDSRRRSFSSLSTTPVPVPLGQHNARSPSPPLGGTALVETLAPPLGAVLASGPRRAGGQGCGRRDMERDLGPLEEIERLVQERAKDISLEMAGAGDRTSCER